MVFCYLGNMFILSLLLFELCEKCLIFVVLGIQIGEAGTIRNQIIKDMADLILEKHYHKAVTLIKI